MQLNLEVLATGMIISAAVYWFACKYIRYKPSSDIQLLRKFLHGLWFALILIWENAKANFAVFKIVFSRTIKIDPCIIYFHTNFKTNAARVALANSITLTPGTITVALNDDLFCVHCLNKEMAKGIDDSVFVRQIKKMEG